MRARGYGASLTGPQQGVRCERGRAAGRRLVLAIQGWASGRGAGGGTGCAVAVAVVAGAAEVAAQALGASPTFEGAAGQRAREGFDAARVVDDAALGSIDKL